MHGTATTTIRTLLVQKNRVVIREVRQLEIALTGTPIPALLEPHRSKVLGLAKDYLRFAEQNLADLALGLDNLLEDIRSNTAQVLEATRLMTQVLAGPLLRATEFDRAALRLIQWMHSTDPLTATMPAACRDGDPAVLPLLDFTPIYDFPSLAQRSLLHQPLYLHEYGHVLYFLHRPEMDALVREVQEFISSELEPLSQRNDQRAKRQRELQRDVVLTWYSWAHELFCDAVGLTMCGPAYGYAFSDYLMRLDRGDFVLDVTCRSHPITWLRIRMLALRARSLGYAEMAREILEHWADVADSIGVTEDFFGYFEATWQGTIETRINDMLTEASPRVCQPHEAVPVREWQTGDSPVLALNRAWLVARQQPTKYITWEKETIARLTQDPPNGRPEPHLTEASPNRPGVDTVPSCHSTESG